MLAVDRRVAHAGALAAPRVHRRALAVDGPRLQRRREGGEGGGLSGAARHAALAITPGVAERRGRRKLRKSLNPGRRKQEAVMPISCPRICWISQWR